MKNLELAPSGNQVIFLVYYCSTDEVSFAGFIYFLKNLDNKLDEGMHKTYRNGNSQQAPRNSFSDRKVINTEYRLSGKIFKVNIVGHLSTMCTTVFRRNITSGRGIHLTGMNVRFILFLKFFSKEKFFLKFAL